MILSHIDDLALKVGAEIWPDTVRNTEDCARFARALIAKYEMAAGSEPVGLDSFVQSVPEHCDRVIWRNSYYALPIRPDPRVAELEQENARLRFALADTEALELGTAERLALAQADNQRLREFAQKISEQIPEKPDYWSSCGQCSNNADEAEDLIAQSQDVSALDAIVQKAGEVMRERAIKKWETCNASEDWNFGHTIRTLPGVTLEDIK